MDCAILSLRSALEKVNHPDTLSELRLQYPHASEEALLENIAESRSDYEQAIALLQACNALTLLDDEVEIEFETSSKTPGDWN